MTSISCVFTPEEGVCVCVGRRVTLLHRKIILWERVIIKRKQEGENGWSEFATPSDTLACFYPEAPDAICIASGDTRLCQETDKDLEHGHAQRSHLGRSLIETSKMAGLALEDRTRTPKISAPGFGDQTQHKKMKR